MKEVEILLLPFEVSQAKHLLGISANWIDLHSIGLLENPQSTQNDISILEETIP